MRVRVGKSAKGLYSVVLEYHAPGRRRKVVAKDVSKAQAKAAIKAAIEPAGPG